jgi:hypothetical protein
MFQGPINNEKCPEWLINMIFQDLTPDRCLDRMNTECPLNLLDLTYLTNLNVSIDMFLI